MNTASLRNNCTANDDYNDQAYLDTLHEYVKPALGCTEPVSVALASAKCRQMLGGLPTHIEVKVTPNLYKNAMGVMVPGTHDKGLVTACLAGLVAGDVSAGLEVLTGFGDNERALLEQARNTIEVDVQLHDHQDVLFTQVRASNEKSQAYVVIEKQHSHIAHAVLAELGSVLADYSNLKTSTTNQQDSTAFRMSVAQIFEFSLRVELEKIEFLEQSQALNLALAQAGLSENFGLGLGLALQRQMEMGLLSDDLINRAMRLSAAASDARMGGASLAAMSNSGSGNQGIASSLPVVAALEFLETNRDQQLRALCMSQLLAIYIKQQQPSLSALCAANTAAIGAGAAITWLLGGQLQQIESCIQLMVADASGVLCDGANAGCAMKVSTGAGNAIKSALLAITPNLGSQNTMGISLHSADASIAQLGKFARGAMQETDRQIIELIQDCEYQNQKLFG